jgi:trans-aconitate methyltransferase
VLTGRDRLHNIEGEFTIVKCNKCGLERTTPRPTAETMGAYYPDNYGPYQEQAKLELAADTPFKKNARKFLGLNARQLPPMAPGKMLEIGCSSGAYMEQARCLGWSVDGVEFSDEAAASARMKGFNVQTGSIEQATPPSDKKYDVVCAWMVLEHLHKPANVLAKLRGMVNSDGYLVALVPDSQSLAKYLFKERCYDLQLPTHLFHFTPKTLKVMLEQSGWDLERVFWQRNCNTLLWSSEYWAIENKHSRLLVFFRWLRLSNSASKIRTVLSVLLGFTRQSGRIEIWARPINNENDHV